MKKANIQFDNFFQQYVDFLCEKQYFDKRLWKKLVKQFIKRIDIKDRGWRGEFWGKLMRGACMIYDVASTPSLYQTLEKTVKDILQAQDSLGRVSSYTVEKEFHGWDIWSRKYVMLGLEFFLDICKDQKLKTDIISALQKQADYIIDRVNENAIPINTTSHYWGCLNSYSILQPIVKLYQLTKEEKYYRYAVELIEKNDVEGENFFRLAYENRLKPYQYPVTKAYEMISCFEGLLDFYNVCKEEKCLETCIKFADAILESDFTIVGGTGCYDEMFDNSTQKQVTPYEIRMQETCVTVTLIKFLNSLCSIKYNGKYIDAIERALYNVYLGTFKLNEKTNRACVYSYSPLINSTRSTQIGGKKKTSLFDYFGCCIAITGAGLGTIKNCCAYKDDELIRINLFLNGEYQIDSLRFRMDGNYPFNDKVTITLKSTAKDTKFAIRLPIWCKSTQINARQKQEHMDGLVIVQGDFSVDDKIEINFNQQISILNSENFDPEVKDRMAVIKGAITYCIDQRFSDAFSEYDFSEKFEEVQINGMPTIRTKCSDGKILTLIPYLYAGNTTTPITVWIKKG